jgi:hypothetical protein
MSGCFITRHDVGVAQIMWEVLMAERNKYRQGGNLFKPVVEVAHAQTPKDADR